MRPPRERLVVSNDWLNPSIGRRCMLEAEQWRLPLTVSHSRLDSGQSVTYELAGHGVEVTPGEATNGWFRVEAHFPVPASQRSD